MTMNELADALDKIDEDAFASFLLEYEITHDDGPEVAHSLPSGISTLGRIGTPVGSNNPVERDVERH
jgi:hypothetical protein